MKKIISFILALSLCGGFMTANINYVSATPSTPIMYQDLKDFSEWKCTEDITYPAFLGTIEFHKDTFTTDNLDMDNFSTEFTFKGKKESIKDYGSLLYCMCYLMVASGLINESEIDNSDATPVTKGLDPGMMMWLLMYTYGAVDGEYDGNTWSSMAGTSKQYEEFINPLVQDKQANDRLKFSEQIDLKGMESQEQFEAIQKEMVSGKYVLLKFKDPSKDAPLWVMVESLNFKDDASKFVMGTLNPTKGETLDEYDMSTLECMETWEPSPDLQTRILWYRDYTRNQSDVEGVPAYLQLINRTNPTTQEIIDSFTYVTYESYKINSILENDLKNMFKAALNEKSIGISVEKCFETTDESSAEYKKYSNDTTMADYAINYLQDGFKSEHNLGLAIDLADTVTVAGTKNKNNIMLDLEARIPEFTKSPTYEWLIKHSYEYGFILRYPEDGEARTGYRFNPYHFRYIGPDYAKKFITFTGGVADDTGDVTGMYSNGKTFEDFFDEVILQDFKTDKLKQEIQDGEKFNPNYYSNNIVRLISYLIDNPIKGTGNVILCIMEIVHEATTQNGVGNLLNCNFVIRFIINTNIYTYIVAICMILMAIAIGYYAILFIKGIFPLPHLLRLFGRGFIITTIPIVAIAFLNYWIMGISDGGFSSISSRAIIRDIETYKQELKEVEEETLEDGRFAVYSDEQLHEMAFNGSTYKGTDYSSIQMTFKDPYGKEQNRNIAVNDLYNQLCSEEFFDVKKMESTENHLLYQCNNFTPVHYEYYTDSVFYYFYDWVVYQYLHYWQTHPSVNKEVHDIAVQFIPPEKTEARDEYVDRISDLWIAFSKNSTGNVRTMYLDDTYVYPRNSEFINDICGLSSMLRMVPDDNKEYCLPNDIYMSTNSFKELYKTGSQSFSALYGDYDTYLETIGTEKDQSKNLLIPVTLTNSGSWLYYSDRKLGSGTYKGSRFTPTFLLDKYHVDYYSSWNDTADLKKSNFVEMQKSQRVPLRVYGSYARMFQDLGKIDADRLEVSLNSINEQAYKSIYNTINKYSGQVTDEVLLMYIALEMTSSWNREMSAWGHEVYPQGITADDLTLDKVLKGVYADDTASSNTMSFMRLVATKYNGFVAFLVLLLDIMYILTGAARVLLLLLLNVSIFISCMSVLFTHKFKLNEWTIGLFCQIAAVVLVQFLFVGSMNLASNFISVNNNFSTIVATLILIVIALLMFSITLACAFALIKSMRTFGGVKIMDAVANCVEEVRQEMSVSHSQKTLNIKNAQMAESNEKSILQTKDIMHNATMIDRNIAYRKKKLIREEEDTFEEENN